MNSYTQLVNTFVTGLRDEPDSILKIFNELHPLTLCPIEMRSWKPLTDAEDIPVETMTRSQMRARLHEDGWNEDQMKDTLEGVAIDDSYTISALLDISNPLEPRVVMPCDFAPFTEYCGNDEYIWSGVFRWRAIQEFAATFAAANMIAVTMDCTEISFPLPSPNGGRSGRGGCGRTARRRQRAKKGLPSRGSRVNRKTRKTRKTSA